jgi:two-component system chemotaxis response regulator CheY
MKKTVLVVDDFEVNTYATGFALTHAGYNVLKATSGKQALKLAAENQIDLLVTDYKMPEMDGVELIIALKQNPRYKYIPVLVLTTETSQEKKEKAQDAGITGWIQKPFNIERFLKLVEKALK